MKNNIDKRYTDDGDDERGACPTCSASAAALPVGETCGALFALWLMNRWLKAHDAKTR